MSIYDDMESEVRGYCRDYPVTFTTARNAEMIDSTGATYIDFLGGAGVLNYGHNNPVIKQAVIEYMQNDGVLHGLDLHTGAKERFLTAMRDLILEPRGMDHKIQFTGPTGTNAVEAAMKIARKHPGRGNIVPFTNGYHGMPAGALAATANSKHRDVGMQLHGVTFMPYENYFGPDVDTIAIFERMLEDPSSGLDTPAAILIESVQGEGGVNVASFDWLRRLQALCRKHGILFIMDDIQIGCGRSGTFFSFEGQDLDPDMVVLSKSIGGIGLPMAVVLMKPEYDLWKPGEHNGTFRGNNLAFVAAAVAIETYWKDDSFTRVIRNKGRKIRTAFLQIKEDHPELGLKVRGRGMMWGLEFADPACADATVGAAYQRGLIIENCGPQGRVMKFLGPLTMEDDVLDRGLERFAEAIAHVASTTASGTSEINT
jgi:diaminobutyrate-2-oxoglutarate transaminase